jgi:hypothetical protein
MASRLVQLSDGTLVEIQVPQDQARQIAGGFADKVDAGLEKMKPLLLNVCQPIKEAWNELSKEMNVEQAEVELGLSFEGEGNLFITKYKGEANLSVKLIFKPKK